MGVGNSSPWKVFDSNKWIHVSPETSKQIDDEIRKGCKNTQSSTITFPLTKGKPFSQHQGLCFCRIGLNPLRTAIMEAVLGNKETGGQKPMQRNPPFKLHPHRNSNRNNNRNNNQYKIMIPTANGTVTQYMTQEQIRNCGFLINRSPINNISKDESKYESKYENIIVNAWDYKQIDDWTCNELQEWIIHLNLYKTITKQIVEAISEQQITGTDFNTMEAYCEIGDSFEIEEGVSKKIWHALVIVRSKSTNAKYQPQNSGIIGLKNLGNTCFINAVIQALLQTPGLIDVLRIWPHSLDNKSRKSSWFGSNEMSTGSMLDAFIEVARAAFQPNAANKSLSPKSIVKCLRNSDVKFGSGEQGDALSAVSKILELLDGEMIYRARKAENREDESKHSGSWFNDGSKDEDEDEDEDEILECEWYKYNPEGESIIRDYIHFIERNVFTCMQCGWSESRYDVKDKILLALQDRSIKVSIDIYIPSIKSHVPVIPCKKCVVLDYCPIETLRYQVFQEVISGGHMEVKDISQISMHYIKPQNIMKTTPVGAWIDDCDEKANCSGLFNKSIFAVVNSAKSDDLVAVKTYNIFIDECGNVDEKQSYLEIEEIKKGETKSFADISKQGYPQKQIYFDETVKLDKNVKYECRILEKNATIVCFWMQEENKLKWNVYDMSNIDAMLVIEISDKLEGETPNHEEIVQFIKMKIDKEKDEDEKETLTEAMTIYQALSENQIQATNLVYNAFGNKFNFVKTEQPYVRTMEAGYNTYYSTKVMDRGAVLICRGNCGGKRCKVFQQETKIVRFPQILIFGIDRYMYGQKYDGCVGYQQTVVLDDNEYELYGVCNHTGGLQYGHYWAFVKGVDDNQINQWYIANDSKIKPISANKVINQATAILLFYKKSVN